MIGRIVYADQALISTQEFEPSRASSLMWLADVKSNLNVVYGPPALQLEDAVLGTTLAQSHAWTTPVPALFLGSISCRPLPGWNTAGDCYQRFTTAQVIHRESKTVPNITLWMLLLTWINLNPDMDK